MSDIRGKTVEELQELNERGLLSVKDIPEYFRWGGMKARCYNPNEPSYKNYGPRGITVYEPWRTNFWMWFRHIGRRPEGNYWQDRIDNDDGYKPGNVRWTTPKVSSNNKRQDKSTKLTAEAVEHIRTARGGPLTQAQLADIHGVCQAHISATQLGRNHNPEGTYERPPMQLREQSANGTDVPSFPAPKSQT